jgi:hypothetical protein
MIRRLWRAPLVAGALLSLLWGMWLGLLRLGWVLPLPWPDQLILHGPLMIGGFVGTLIGLERAIGVARPWAYAAPVASAAAALVLIFLPPTLAGPLLLVVASAVVAAVFVVVLRAHATLFAATMFAGAAAWLVGNVLWAAGFAVYRVVFWWIAFLVLTIAGERLELNRLLRPTRSQQAQFIVAVAFVISGVALTMWLPAAGVRVVGVGLATLCAWLALNDIARRTIRQGGLTRYIASCLLGGYVWLAVAAILAIVTAAYEPGPLHDALLHTIFLGFVVSMIFGHAPIVFPAITGRPMPFESSFYAPVVLLHLSVIVRVLGDLVEVLGRWRGWGGMLNAAAILVFAVNTARVVAAGALATSSPPNRARHDRRRENHPSRS